MPYLGVFCNRLNGMGAQKNVLLEKVDATFFPGIFYVKTKWDGLRILGGKKSLQETQISYPKCIECRLIL